jgi:hypothetical protein
MMSAMGRSGLPSRGRRSLPKRSIWSISVIFVTTENVELDEKGVYAVLLGSNTASGLPEELFFTGDARWLGIQPEREPELTPSRAAG